MRADFMHVVEHWNRGTPRFSSVGRAGNAAYVNSGEDDFTISGSCQRSDAERRATGKPLLAARYSIEGIEPLCRPTFGCVGRDAHHDGLVHCAREYFACCAVSGLN
jgi:hypothetical protein